MGVINIIQACKSEQQLLKYIRYRLEKCIRETEELNAGIDYIGDNVDINPRFAFNDFSNYYEINPYWEGFIPPGVKIVYGVDKGYACHNGYYYFMNDFDYLIEFVEYIRKEEIRGENDIISAIHNFMRKYYIKPLEVNRREKFFQLLVDSNGMYYTPTKERTIGDFKGRTLARCTEFAATAQNLLTFMGIESIYVHDISHAYNLVTFSDKTRAVVDYSKCVNFYNDNDKTRKLVPFIGLLNDSSDEFVLRLISNQARVEFKDYNIFNVGNMYFQQSYSKMRRYGVDGMEIEAKRLVK